MINIIVSQPVNHHPHIQANFSIACFTCVVGLPVQNVNIYLRSIYLV